MASINIAIKFSDELLKNIEKAKSEGEDTDVFSVIHRLFSMYKKGFGNDPNFTRPLKALDKKVRICVTADVNGKTLK